MGLKRLSEETVTSVVSPDVKLLITQKETSGGNEENVVRRVAWSKIIEETVDSTLTEEGSFADAKAVGDALASTAVKFSDPNNDGNIEVTSLADEWAEEFFESSVAKVTEDWLEENIQDGSMAVVDSSLSVSGAMADAKKTGDEISGLKNHLNAVVPYPESPDSKYGTAGQLLRTKGNGKTEWVDEGLPTDEQTAEAVTAWLNEHPEATTTVQDGAISKAKLAPAVAKCLGSQTVYNVSNFDILPNTEVDLYTQIFDLLKNHVSETGGIVYFPAGEYQISDCIFIPSNTIFVGEGAATRIIYTGEYSSMGVGLSNGGDNVGIVNMTVDTLETGPIPSGAVVGAIGFATFDYDSLTSYHQSPSNMTRRNAKNLFAVDLWTNSNYILQTETGSLEYSISNVLYRNIHAEKSMVSVMGHENGLINNVVIDNVVCSLLRIGKSGSYNHVVRCNNIVAGRINFRGGRVSAVNVEVRPDLEYEETHMAYAMAIQGTVSIENAYIDASNFSTIIAKYAGDAYLANVIGEKSTTRVWINQEASTENYFVNCKLTTNGNEGSVINGYSSNSKIVSVGNLMTMPGRRVTLEEDTDLNDLLTVGHYQANTAICGTLLNLPSDLTPTAIIVDVTDANAYIQQTITTYTGQTMYKRIITATAGSWYKHVGTKVT